MSFISFQRQKKKENYAYRPQIEAMRQVSTMGQQGQPSPVVSLLFRSYWQFSDPTVWITIISQSPCCVPPVSQKYSQKQSQTRQAGPEKQKGFHKFEANLAC